MPPTRIELRVVTGYRYSQRHGKFYANGTRTYGERRSKTLRMGFRCICGDPLDDGEQILQEPYDRGVIVHENCGDLLEAR